MFLHPSPHCPAICLLFDSDTRPDAHQSVLTAHVGNGVKGGAAIEPTAVPTTAAGATPSQPQPPDAGSHVVIDVDGSGCNGSAANGGNSNGRASDESSSSDSRPDNVAENEKADAAVEELTVNGKGASKAAASKSPPDEDGTGLTRQQVVEEFFQYLFPDTFQLALPVLRHKVRLVLHDIHCDRRLQYMSEGRRLLNATMAGDV